MARVYTSATNPGEQSKNWLAMRDPRVEASFATRFAGINSENAEDV